MTHTLHRSGTIESLKEDFAWLMYQTLHVNDKNIAPKAMEFITAAEMCECSNWGDVKSGNILEMPAEEIKAHLSDASRLRGVFNSREQVAKFLGILKEKDLGISVVISGLLDETLSACKEAGVTPHTINYSLGVWGKKELLPSEEVLAVTTMCGHHQISATIVEKYVDDIAKGKIKAESAALKVGKLCPCGIFNHIRAAKLLAEMADKRKAELAANNN
jgi:hypothetical protein